MCHFLKHYQIDCSIICIKFKHNSLGQKVNLFFVYILVKSCFVILIWCKFDENVALQIKSNFLYINEALIDIYTKVYLDLWTRFKVIYLKEQNMIIAYKLF